MNGTLVPKPGAPTGIETILANPELVSVAAAISASVAVCIYLSAEGI